jgi:hypothetical protein
MIGSGSEGGSGGTKAPSGFFSLSGFGEKK